MKHENRSIHCGHCVTVWGVALLGLGVLSGRVDGQTIRPPRPFGSRTLTKTSRINSSLRSPLSGGYRMRSFLSSGPSRGLLSAGIGGRGYRSNPLLSNMSGPARSYAPAYRGMARRGGVGSAALPAARGGLAGMAVRPIGYGRLVGSLSAGGRPAAQPTFGGQTLRVDPSLLAGNQIGLLSTAGYPEADTQTDWRLVPLPSVADASPTDSSASPAVAVVPVDPKQIALERRVREDRNVVRAAAAFAGGDYAGSLMRLQIAQSRHPRSRLVRHMLIRSLLAQGNVPQAAFHTRVLLRESLGVVDLASLYTDAAYGSAARRSAHGKRLGALAASGRADESLHLLHAYWLIATGEPAAAGEALEKVGSPAYAGAAGRLGDLLK